MLQQGHCSISLHPLVGEAAESSEAADHTIQSDVGKRLNLHYLDSLASPPRLSTGPPWPCSLPISKLSAGSSNAFLALHSNASEESFHCHMTPMRVVSLALTRPRTGYRRYTYLDRFAIGHCHLCCATSPARYCDIQ